MSFDVTFRLLGEPASKANSRKVVKFGNRTAMIKSDKARSYASAVESQMPKGIVPTERDVCVEMVIHYASRRPDLDESLILDLLQGHIYLNDRQVKRKIIYWQLDRAEPRTVIRVYDIEDLTIPTYLLDTNLTTP
jgi:Holliday junction resolvase RusA-like endonuclease